MVIREIYTIWIGKPKREKPLGRTRRRGKGNIKAEVEEIGQEDVATWRGETAWKNQAQRGG